jgi:cytidylate kinase
MNDKPIFITVAIDGAAACGKSSTSRLLADKHHWLHVDTGAHYRCITLLLSQGGISPQENERIQDFLHSMKLSTEVSGNRALIRINGYLPHESELKSEAVNSAVSAFAALPAVRAALLDYQRKQIWVAQEHGFRGLVMEGRDIGSVVLPQATLQVYLQAPLHTRAQRRQDEGLQDAVAQRDTLDSTRTVAPLKCPPGALVIDTSQLDLQQVVCVIEAHLATRHAAQALGALHSQDNPCLQPPSGHGQ